MPETDSLFYTLKDFFQRNGKIISQVLPFYRLWTTTSSVAPSPHSVCVCVVQEEPIRGFRVGEHLEFMRHLESKYRQTVLPDMQNLSKP